VKLAPAPPVQATLHPLAFHPSRPALHSPERTVCPPNVATAPHK